MTAWAVLHGKIWILGGLHEGVALQTVESYDPVTGVWQTQPPLPIPLHHAMAATYRGEVVVLGGASGELTQSSNKVFALRGGSWVELPGLTHARAAAAAAVVGDKLVVAGGQNAKQIVPQTEVFDGTAWHDAANMPTPREHLAAVSDGTYVYTVGGRFLSSDKNSAALEQFDPQSGSWTTLPPMPTPRGSFGATFIDGRILAVGGEEPTRVWGWPRCTTSRAATGPHCPRCRRRVTLRWSRRLATPCTALVAQTGPHTKALLRRSRPWTSSSSASDRSTTLQPAAPPYEARVDDRRPRKNAYIE